MSWAAALIKACLPALLGFAALLPSAAAAHAPDESYLSLQVLAEGGLRGNLQLRLSDLGTALNLDADGDGSITSDEVTQQEAQILDYLQQGLSIRIDEQTRPVVFERLLYGSQHGETFVVVPLRVDSDEVVQRIELQYRLLFESLPGHRGRLRILWPDQRSHRASITEQSETQVYTWDSAPKEGFLHFLGSGLGHIWSGFDHILFLLVLLIPTVYRRTAISRRPVAHFAEALLRVVLIVSVFTVAHSLTLALAAFEWLHPPMRWVEAAIAGSICIAALHNLLPTTAGARGAWLALVLGLLHGFGFAEPMTGVDLSWSMLLAFNLGIELGQLAIVAVFLPIAFALRHSAFYRIGVMQIGSILSALIALFWLIDRVL
jgi:hypothetical protein